uniref:Uncharacterized protein n=1 Tax=Siphoviridae sp. cthL03 TaxID=2825615 RepID=A0A8S5PEW9_9CAUD|nr:hypothetical protein [uncultured Lachnoclostridium sp.]DAE05622.1 MAG TPA: Protein of unknown function (DUF806) [Siphoviridae sp. cthL03]
MEEKLINLIKNTLRIKCDSVFDKIPVPCALVDIYSITPGLVGNGISVNDNFDVQVDLYYKAKNPFDEAVKTLYETLKIEKYYSLPYVEKYFDKEASLYRATFKFYIIESEE